MWCLLVSVASAADPRALQAAWERDAGAIGEHGVVPAFALDTADFEALATGEPIARRTDTADGAFASGAIFVEAPIEAVWVAIQDAPHEPPSAVTFERLAQDGARRQVYMRLDLPWPLADRQWVADLDANADLHAAAGGRVWQRHWTLADPALAPAPDPAALWVSTNRGGWTLIACDGGTLALFTVRTVLGGSIPAGIAQTWATRTLADGMTTMAARARAMPEHYCGDHEPVVMPDGKVLARW